MHKKNCTGNFITTSRDQHQFAFRNKTDPPDVGKYNPRMNSVDKKSVATKINKSIDYLEVAHKSKEFQFSQKELCPKIIKNICNGSGGMLTSVRYKKTESIKKKKSSIEEDNDKEMPSLAQSRNN